MGRQPVAQRGAHTTGYRRRDFEDAWSATGVEKMDNPKGVTGSGCYLYYLKNE